MPKKKRDLEGYIGGQAFSRARKQFQVLYEKEGTFDRAYQALDLILWPELVDEGGKPIRPPEYILRDWAVEMDEGKAQIPERLRKAFLARYDAYTEAAVREALIENAKTSKAMAIQAREGKLPPEKASQYAHANNATSFLTKEYIGRKTITESPRKIGGIKFLAPKRAKEAPALPEPVTVGEFRAIEES